MLPNLLVIGAMKCGTSSLHRYLGLHPEIEMSHPKELNFFIDETENHYIARPNWERGVDWYSDRFQSRARIRGEASPAYTDHPHVRGVPARAATVVPDARLIYLVRDPIDRIVSHYLQRVGARREARPLDVLLREILDLRAPGHGYISRSRYGAQLEQWLAHYPRDRVLVIATEDLLADRVATMSRVFRFLGIDDSFVDERFTTEHRLRAADKRIPRASLSTLEAAANRATRPLPGRLRWRARSVVRRGTSRRLRRPQLSAGRRRQLEDVLREDIDLLRELTGEAFPKWSL
jgi:hypothetical protein